jgi:hypothetical protein
MTHEIQTERSSVELHTNCSITNDVVLVCDQCVMSRAKGMAEQ